MKTAWIAAAAVTAGLMAGCGGQTYPVAYPEAVKLVAEMYPAPAPGGPDLAGTTAAYSNEMVPGEMQMAVDHKEVAAGQTFRIQVVKSWKYSSDRKTTVTVERADNGVKVDVQSQKKLGDIWMPDGMYAMMRQMEIRNTLKKQAP